MDALRGVYPRVVLDVELYRPKTGRRGRAGFFHSRLVAVGLAVQEGPGRAWVDVLHGDDEAGLVRSLLARLERVASQGRRPLLAGYNILSLDIPIILSKAYEHLGPREARRAAGLLYRRFLVFDMFQHALGEYTGTGLPGFRWLYHRLACLHGLPEPDKGSGYDVHGLYEEGRMGEIVEYSRLDAALHLAALAALLDGGGEARRILEALGVGGPAAGCR